MNNNKNNHFIKTISHGLLLAAFLTTSSVTYSQDSLSSDLELFNQGVLMSADGDWSAAEKIFREVAKRHPEWPEPKNNLAIALYNSGKLELARQFLDEAVTSLPGFKVAHDNRQRLYDYSATIAYYKVVGIPEEPELPSLVLLTEIQQGADQVSNAAKSVPVSTSATVATAAVSPGQISDIEGQIANHIVDWSTAWSAADVDAYISKYSRNFKPAEVGKSYQQWRTDRTNKLRFGKISQVRVESIEVFINSNQKQAVAQFVQHYKSSTYQDKVIKQLMLAWEDGRWLIHSERVLQQLY